MSLSLRRYRCPCISGDICVPTVPVSPEISMSQYLRRLLFSCYVAAAAAVPEPGSPDALWAGPPDSCTGPARKMALCPERGPGRRFLGGRR